MYAQINLEMNWKQQSFITNEKTDKSWTFHTKQRNLLESVGYLQKLEKVNEDSTMQTHYACHCDPVTF